MKKSDLQAGFTLIELMVVMAIVGILAAVAYPSYREHVIKVNRSSAKAQVLDISNRQQQFLAVNRTYATKTQLESAGYTMPVELVPRYSYTITLGAGVVPSYMITFSPIGAQAGDGDLTLNDQGGKTGKW